MIRFENVSKIYPGMERPALDNVNLEIEKGEFVFLVGLSGSGKSTFLRLVLREERPTTGTIHVAGKDLNTLPNHKVPELRRQRHILRVVPQPQQVALPRQRDLNHPLDRPRPRREDRAAIRQRHRLVVLTVEQQDHPLIAVAILRQHGVIDKKPHRGAVGVALPGREQHRLLRRVGDAPGGVRQERVLPIGPQMRIERVGAFVRDRT